MHVLLNSANVFLAAHLMFIIFVDFWWLLLLYIQISSRSMIIAMDVVHHWHHVHVHVHPVLDILDIFLVQGEREHITTIID